MFQMFKYNILCIEIKLVKGSLCDHTYPRLNEASNGFEVLNRQAHANDRLNIDQCKKYIFARISAQQLHFAH
jgi:hypothetical protein